jgi:hypothetical protein
MSSNFRRIALAAFLLAAPALAQAADICAGKKPGTFTFYNQEVSRSGALPAPVTALDYSGPMFAVGCMAQKVGPQASGGDNFRVVLYVDRKQMGVFRPQLSISRRDLIISIGDDFKSALNRMVDNGTHEFRLQAATETPTDTIDISISNTNDVAYIQQLRKAGYVADSKVTVTKSK